MRDQDGCDACWAFAVTALVESAVHIEHGVWCVRSEGDVHDGIGARCGSTGNPGSAIGWIKEHGLCDPDCYPWRAGDNAYSPGPDREGRTVKLDEVSDVWMGNTDDQKHWLDTVGPIICSIEVYEDFDAYKSGIYTHTSGADRGWHIMLCVGFDDNQRCWIVKNQWGTGWGESGYVRIGYGEANVDANVKIGLRGTNPDGWLKRRLNSGTLLESGNGATHRDFELLTRLPDGRIAHRQRDNSLPDYPWREPWILAGDAAGPPAVVESTYGRRNLELVYRSTANRLRHWYFDNTMKSWNDTGMFGPGRIAGEPALAQTSDGAPGSLEVVVRTSDARFAHVERRAGDVWRDLGRFGATVAATGPALVDGRTGLELVYTAQDGTLRHWAKPRGGAWGARGTFAGGASGGPCMIEGQYGATDEVTPGNLELCVVAAGRVEHWWFEPANGTWRRSATFGANVARVTGLLESSFGFNLEAILELADGTVEHWYRADGTWSLAGRIA